MQIINRSFHVLKKQPNITVLFSFYFVDSFYLCIVGSIIDFFPLSLSAYKQIWKYCGCKVIAFVKS